MYVVQHCVTIDNIRIYYLWCNGHAMHIHVCTCSTVYSYLYVCVFTDGVSGYSHHCFIRAHYVHTVTITMGAYQWLNSARVQLYLLCTCQVACVCVCACVCVFTTDC